MYLQMILLGVFSHQYDFHWVTMVIFCTLKEFCDTFHALHDCMTLVSSHPTGSCGPCIDITKGMKMKPIMMGRKQ